MLTGESGLAILIAEGEDNEAVGLADDSSGTWGLLEGQGAGASAQPFLLEAISRTPWAWRPPSDSLRLLDRTLAAIAQTNPLAAGVRAAATLARLDDEDILEVAHYGDVLAILLSDQPVLLTPPHTLFREQVRVGLRSLDDHERYAHHGVLTRVAGAERGAAPEVSHHQPEPGDTLVLCTPGVCSDLDRGPLTIADLANLATGRHPQDAADAILQEATARARERNAGVLVVAFD